MIRFEETMIGHRGPFDLTAFPDQWTALFLLDQSHAPEVAATLLGERPPERGRVTIGGVDLYEPGEEGVAPLFEKIGVVTDQGRLLSNLSVGENIALPYQYRGLLMNSDAREVVVKLIEELGSPAASLRTKLDRRVTALDYDERRWCELLRATLAAPDYFLFLNVTDDLGEEESLVCLEMLRRVRRKGKGAFFLMTQENRAILDSMDVVHTL